MMPIDNNNAMDRKSIAKSHNHGRKKLATREMTKELPTRTHRWILCLMKV
jgi:hypothetical protein